MTSAILVDDQITCILMVLDLKRDKHGLVCIEEEN